MIFQKLIHKCNKMFLRKSNSALERKSPCATNKILRNNRQLAFLMLIFYRRDHDSYIHSKETESVENSIGSFSLRLLSHAGPFSYVLFESVKRPQTIINVSHVLCSLRRLKMPVIELQSQSALHEGQGNITLTVTQPFFELACSWGLKINTNTCAEPPLNMWASLVTDSCSLWNTGLMPFT